MSLVSLTLLLPFRTFLVPFAGAFFSFFAMVAVLGFRFEFNCNLYWGEEHVERQILAIRESIAISCFFKWIQKEAR